MAAKKLTSFRELKELKGSKNHMKKLDTRNPYVTSDNINEFYNLPNSQLDIRHFKPFNTIFGVTATIERGLAAGIRIGFPKELISKPILSKEENAYIDKLRKQILPNYWAYLGYLVAEKLFQNPKLVKKIHANDKEFASVDITYTETLAGNVMHIVPNEQNTHMYLGIIREFSTIIHRDGGLTKESVEALLEDLKKVPDKSIFANIPNIHVVGEQPKVESGVTDVFIKETKSERVPNTEQIPGQIGL